MQAPLIRHVNDDAQVWSELWQEGVKLGMIPYYMFIERDTGARGYFEVPLARCYEIFRDAFQQVSGLARTVRGPSMSAFPRFTGKRSLSWSCFRLATRGMSADRSLHASIRRRVGWMSCGPRSGKPAFSSNRKRRASTATTASTVGRRKWPVIRTGTVSASPGTNRTEVIFHPPAPDRQSKLTTLRQLP